MAQHVRVRQFNYFIWDREILDDDFSQHGLVARRFRRHHRGQEPATRFPAGDLRPAQMPQLVPPLPAIDALSRDTHGKRRGQLLC
jgi:hypothetical protein